MPLALRNPDGTAAAYAGQAAREDCAPCCGGGVDCCQATFSLPVENQPDATGLHAGFVPGEELAVYAPVDLTAEPGGFAQSGVVLAGSTTHDWTDLAPSHKTSTIDWSGSFPDRYNFGQTIGDVDLTACEAFATVQAGIDQAGGIASIRIEVSREYDTDAGEYVRFVNFDILTNGQTIGVLGANIRVRWSMADEVWLQPVFLPNNNSYNDCAADFSITHLANYVRFQIGGNLDAGPGFGGRYDLTASALRINIHKRWLDWCDVGKNWNGIAPTG